MYGQFMDDNKNSEFKIVDKVVRFIIKDIEVNRYIKEWDGDYYYTDEIHRAKPFLESELKEMMFKYRYRKLKVIKVKITYELLEE